MSNDNRDVIVEPRDDRMMRRLALPILLVFLCLVGGVVVYAVSSNQTKVEAANKRMIQSIKNVKDRSMNYCSNDQTTWYLHEDGATYENVLVVNGKAYAIMTVTMTRTEVPTDYGYAGVIEGSIDQIKENYHPFWNELREKLDKCPKS